MSRHSSRMERVLHDEIGGDSKPPPVQRAIHPNKAPQDGSPGNAAPLSYPAPNHRPLQSPPPRRLTPSSTISTRTPSTKMRPTRPQATTNSGRSPRLGVGELEDGGDDRPVKPPARRSSASVLSFSSQPNSAPLPPVLREHTSATNFPQPSALREDNSDYARKIQEAARSMFGWRSPASSTNTTPVSSSALVPPMLASQPTQVMGSTTRHLAEQSFLEKQQQTLDNIPAVYIRPYATNMAGVYPPLPDQFTDYSSQSSSSRSLVTDKSSIFPDSVRSATVGDEVETSTLSTVDLVLTKRYMSGVMSPENCTPLSPPAMLSSQPSRLSQPQIQREEIQIEADHGVLLDDDDDDEDGDNPNTDYNRLLLTEKLQEQQRRFRLYSQQQLRSSLPISDEKRNMRISTPPAQVRRSSAARASDDNDNISRSDSVSTVPDPPSLHQRGHYTQPGAFRMRSGGVARPVTSDQDSLASNSVRSLGTFRTTASRARPPVLEASLVEEPQTAPPPTTLTASVTSTTINSAYASQSQSNNFETVPDDECPGPPEPANFAVSIGEMTAMTQATATSTIVEAQPFDEGRTIRAFFRTWKVQTIIFCLSITFIILTLGTVYGVTGFVFSQAIETLAPTAAPASSLPTSPPTSTGDLDLEFFARMVLPAYTRDALRRDSSPQSKALTWLRNNSMLEFYSVEQRLQRFALATIYFSTGGDRRWEQNNGWMSDDEECTWYSRMKSPDPTDICEEGRYRILSLSRNRLRGTLPPEVALLTSLEIAELSDNDITGFIPTTLSELSQLQELNFYNNYLTGTIPSSLGDLTALRIFNVEYNFLAQILPETLGNLGSLEELNLDRNLLVGQLPSEYGQLVNLNRFQLSFNKFSGTLPSQIGGMSSIVDLRLELNSFSGTIPTEVGLLTELVGLTFGNNTFEGTIPTEIGRLQKITYLDFFDNALSGTIPSEIGSLTTVERLYFEMNELSGRIPAEVGLLENVKRLWMHANRLDGPVPTEIGFLTGLTSLDVAYNLLSETLPTEIGLLTNLEQLFLESNGFSGAVPSELGLLTDVVTLALHRNKFTGHMPEEVCALVSRGTLARVNLTVNCNMVNCTCCNCYATSSRDGQ